MSRITVPIDSSTTGRHTMVYDSDCGICTRFKNVISFLDAHQRLAFAPLLTADKDGLLDSVPAHRRHRSFHLVNPSGRVYSGADALPILVGLLPAGRPLESILSSAPPAMWLTRVVYESFVRHHDSGSCTYPVRTEKATKFSALDFTKFPSKANSLV